MRNVTRIQMLLSIAEEIDPDFCDLHWQVGQFIFKRIQLVGHSASHSDILNFEERLTKAVLCPFTSNAAQPIFRQYWQTVTKGGQDKDSLLRYNQAMQIIQEAIEDEDKRKRSGEQVQDEL